uniref:tomoregulin-1-like n=1 Tax=Myxine glutinosa TaxID=7769 RepID=UPI003590124C
MHRARRATVMVRALGVLFLPLCALGLPTGKEPAAALVSLAARTPNASAAMCGNGSLANCTDTGRGKAYDRTATCDGSTCKYGGICVSAGNGMTCICVFQCFPDRVPVCGADGLTYDTACHMRQASCRLQRNITVVSYGPCYNDVGSASGDRDYDISGSEPYRKSTKCGICLYGSECDEDAEDVGCVCNIDCAGHNSNPVCASDGVSYENPCLVKEASCMKQQRIEVRFLGKCPSDSIRDMDEPIARDYGMPCPEQFRSFCINGYCEYSGNQQEPACLCEPGYVGRQCESKENMLYVVPDGNNLRYVLIAAVVGAVQLTVTFALVVCVARKCPKNRRRR